MKRIRREHTPRIFTISDSFKRQIFQQDDLGYCIGNKIQFLYHCADEKEIEKQRGNATDHLCSYNLEY